MAGLIVGAAFIVGALLANASGFTGLRDVFVELRRREL